MLRTHSRAWLQHLVVQSDITVGRRFPNAGEPELRLRQSLGDVEYQGLVAHSNRWPSRIFGTVTSKILRPESLTWLQPHEAASGTHRVAASIQCLEASEATAPGSSSFGRLDPV